MKGLKLLLVLCLFLTENNGYRYSLIAHVPRPISFRIQSPYEIMTERSNSLGFNILYQRSMANPLSNFAFSPCGLMSVMVAIYEGCNGHSATQIQTAVRLPWKRNIMQIGFRDIHRRVKTYFYVGESIFGGLHFNRDPIFIRPEYETVLRFYGFDFLSPASQSTPQNITSTPSMHISTASSVTTSSSSTIKLTMPTTRSTTPAPQMTTTENVITITTPMTTSKELPITNVPSTEQPKSTSPATSIPTTLPTTSIPTTLPTTSILTTIPTTSIPTTLTTPTMPTTLPTTTIPTTIATTQMETTTDIPTTTLRTTVYQFTFKPKITLPTIPTTEYTELPTTPITTEATTDLPTTTNLPKTTQYQFTFKPILNIPPPDIPVPSRAASARSLRLPATYLTPYFNEQRSKRQILNLDYDSLLSILRNANRNTYYENDTDDIKPNQQPPEPIEHRTGSEDIGTHKFHITPYESVEVPFKRLNSVLKYLYIQSMGTTFLEVPLESDKYSLLLIVPDEDTDVNQISAVMQSSHAPKLETIRSKMESVWVKAEIPEFHLNDKVTLTNDLQNLGIYDIFEPTRANFDAMTTDSGIFVKHVEQPINLNIRIREAEHLKHHNLRFDSPVNISVTQPFMFTVIDNELDVVLLIGRIVNPLNTRIQ